MACLIWSFAACGGTKVGGTYSNGGSAVLELRSGGEASLTFMGETEACTYQVSKDKLLLDCGGDKIAFTIHDDGSLSGPPGNFIGVFRKTKT